MASPLIQLSQLISTSVSALETVCAENALNIPQLEDTFTPGSEAFRSNPIAAEAANIIAAASLQLAAAVLPPHHAIFHIISGHFKSASLRVCLEANVTEILREAGPEGLHVDAIAAKSKIDGMKLGRMMRYLATHHIYREVKPEVFTNNRLSGMLDTGKSVKDLFSNPDGKHEDTLGFAALAGHLLDESHKSSAFIWETMKDPISAMSGDPNLTPFNRAFKEDSTFFSWLEKPGQTERLHRFGVAMQGVSAMQPADAILAAFDWNSLPKNALVVDVGGGVGASALPLAEEHPHLRIVIQDRPSVVEKGIKVWGAKMPQALKSGRVQFSAHDFFTPQPVKDAAVFLLKQIAHDWADPSTSTILVQLRKAATPETRLLLIDSVMPYACHDPNFGSKNAVPGSVSREAPAPLLPNYGGANEMGYTADVNMFILFNSQERTILHLAKLLESTGWRMLKVHRSDGASNFLQPVEAEPI